MATKTDQCYEIARPSWLELTPEEIARLTMSDRIARVGALMEESRYIYDEALNTLIVDQRKDYVGTAVCYSGGNDSTILTHWARPLADLALHSNTGIGIEQTREFVRETCADWGLTLIERKPPTSYRDLLVERIVGKDGKVTGGGFPGPGQHFKAYQRLKERQMHSIRSELITHTQRERVVYLAGRRRDESARRDASDDNDDPGIPLWEREGSLIWVSPLVYWTKLDMNTYRLMHTDHDPVPRNRVSDLLHMSGECLCGAFAKRDELAQIRLFYWEVADEIHELEHEVHAFCRECNGGHIPHERCFWGWGAYRADRKQLAAGQPVGAMCSSCTIEEPEVIVA
jgi:3'-phosphoadenosine 5'-phosphosulfate sulfotransferase (PAPS reductase)/FAD synthetase